MGENGPIKVDDSDFIITDSGEVLSNGTSLGRLSLSYVTDPNLLEKVGRNIYKLDEGTDAAVPAGTKYNIIQGVITSYSIHYTKLYDCVCSLIKLIDVPSNLLQ